jgi:hypothetical protein
MKIRPAEAQISTAEIFEIFQNFAHVAPEKIGNFWNIQTTGYKVYGHY